MQSLPSHASGPVDLPLLEDTIGERLRRITERFADREALVVRHQDYRATYAELSDQVELAARALIANGVRRSDRVGIWAPNRFEWVVVQYAIARVGAILVTINPAYKAAELRYALHKAGVSLLFSARGFRGANYVAMLDEVSGDCPALRDIGCSTTSGDASWRRASARAPAISASARRHFVPGTRSTSSTPPGRRASRKGPRSHIATSSTTVTSPARY